ncbi:MAG: hypothetical protein A2X05_01490 [Bacteroidetes bacterium GWE2_41_25]|nr:MAG: hypothetical protein A2X03_11675 [Bacteroidetes bacterium GWA2_40_15]OFX90370.1 MAG: hypothetical protein A2X06_14705 [Bacteroidetes bacterium GWC2_40_22]OFY08962.1 MAG: hypothetical protein A2X05_01490 [Bacteroidetes bacterium GWE2_41_25]OFY61568.1 MAG: hypothetical protein A2X04_02025 [Bacteroidetes bacterium GWF2_41_9]HAM09345.1 hypothetical protein [Bacteroidales bacterium]
MVKIILLVLFYFAFPLVIIYLCRRWPLLKKPGSIVLAYGFGLLFGSVGILPQGSDAYHMALHGRTSVPSAEMEALMASGTISEADQYANSIASSQDMLISVIVPLAFPLLLFSLNIRRWMRFAREGFISMILALISVIIIVSSGYFIFREVVPESWKVAGMLVGVYTGGTPNLVSLKVALGVDPNLFVMTSTYDMILGAITIIFFITAGPKLFRAILPPFKHNGGFELSDKAMHEAESFEDFTGMFREGRIVPLMTALGLAFLIFVISFGISLLFPGISQMVVVILSITTLAILASLVPWLNKIEKTFQLGMYFILVFSFTVASMADLKVIFSIGYLGLFAYISYAYFGSLVLHIILSKIFRVNADDFLITTTAFVFSPPFVPVVAGALKNKDVIITGITVGIIGYVIGNYLGVALGYFLKGF